MSDPIVAPGQSITLTDKSLAGETVNHKEDYIVVSSQSKDGLKNLALNKDAKANAEVNENESAKFAFDGRLNSKWCTLGESGNWIEVDLGKENIIKELRMSHAQAGGEAASMNTSEYTIEISQDGENWVELDDIKGNNKAVSRNDLNYELARYVRVKINKSEQGSGGATRIYEIEVLGIDSDKILVLDNKEVLYQLNNTINILEKEYYKLGIQNNDFETLLNKCKNIVDKVEVEIEDIVEAENDLISAFEILKIQ